MPLHHPLRAAYGCIRSTVVKMSTVRLVLAIAAAKDYNLTSVDIRQAYLQAEAEVARDVPQLPRHQPPAAAAAGGGSAPAAGVIEADTLLATRPAASFCAACRRMFSLR